MQTETMAAPQTSKQISRVWRLILPVIAALAVSGCGPGRERGTVTGTVKFQGRPVTDGEVIFSDNANAVFMTAPIQPDGTFEVATAEGKGIWAGNYRVAVAPRRVDPQIGVSTQPAAIPKPSDIPPRYWKPETSGIQYEVKEGENRPLEIELTP
jgi:hypothetical protein